MRFRHPAAALDDVSRDFTTPIEVVDRAMASLKCEVLSRAAARMSTPRLLRLRRDLVYVVLAMPAGPRILLNRWYKPVGMPGVRDWVTYEEFTGHHVTLTVEQLRQVVAPGRQMGLFGDGDAPWRGKQHAEAYLARLERLRTMVA